MTAARVKLVVSVLVSLFALRLLLSGVDLPALLLAWSRMTAPGLLLALALLAAGYALRVARWWWMLLAFEPRLRWRDCATPFLASIALNNVLPLRAGDAVRAFAFRDALRLPPATLLGSVLLERLLDLAMLLVLFFAGASLVRGGGLPPGLAATAQALAAAAVGALVLLPLAGPAVARRLAGPTSEGTGWKARTGRIATDLLASFSLLRSPRRAALLLPMTALIWLLEGAVFAAVAAELAPGTPAAAGWFAMTTGTLATLLPSTPGYVGTFDYFTMLGFSAFGLDRAAATAISLSVHAILWAPVTALGLVLLVLHGGRDAIRARARASEGALT
ncbi:MAG TPA: lysylphosphatidylglycerol synthase transmembrane domain-containing protein [Ramlibacter sp.]|jgi:uncharacterized membrane protein YbhN (UPF0104 family)|uniref:lysylphosphatidylglycerol synthase transmembrane domain-containing protein n=1 Tax=Ramlibacter sp. TaxID=1917967 RepID=UPI002D2DBA46|nr:lysylphosphatidylglycerol synthase transmembrane domain-containing protein [Ramlibacter sp.]HZY17330.1 lysylphosphatidylglycerol synthase transmembrane domain-containing protein [Ramlibacter sp.]